MFMLTMGDGMTMGFPDVCLTPAGPVPVPVPYPNISESIMAPDAAMNVLGDCMPTLHQLSDISLSEGDEAGVLLGVVSHLMSGETMWILGSETIMAEGLPVQRLTSIGGCNALEVLPNGPATCIVPSQYTVLALG